MNTSKFYIEAKNLSQEELGRLTYCEIQEIKLNLDSGKYPCKNQAKIDTHVRFRAKANLLWWVFSGTMGFVGMYVAKRVFG